jgi:uncharacterized RDD family membrane protein YckC
MRCPKCQYLGFDGQERCRNCGYDFSLSRPLPEAAPAPIESGPDEDASADLPLRAEPTARERARAAIRQRQAAARTPGSEPFDLPLFESGDRTVAGPPEPAGVDPVLSDPPLVSRSPTPRVPLAVRRPSADVPRARPGTTPAPDPIEPALGFDLDLAPADTTPETEPAPVVAGVSSEPVAAAATHAGATPDRAAPIGTRLAAGAIDAAILGAVDVAVVAFTLQVTGVAWTGVVRLPLVPLAAFLALLATGYLTLFTVLAGQTAGKMAMGIRVVEAGGRPVRFGHAVLRSALQVLTVPLLGLGFLPALLGVEHRALYDRLSNTEVVRCDS